MCPVDPVLARLAAFFYNGDDERLAHCIVYRANAGGEAEDRAQERRPRGEKVEVHISNG